MKAQQRRAELAAIVHRMLGRASSDSPWVSLRPIREELFSAEWLEELTVRFRSASYEILVENPDGVCRGIVAITVDGAAVGERPFAVKMQDDGVTHHVLARLG